MKLPVAFTFAVIALVLAIIALLARQAEADDYVTIRLLDDSQAPMLQWHFTCTGGDVETLVGHCRERLLQVCPQGGTVGNTLETAEGVTPLRIEFDVTCTSDPEAI